VHHDAVAVVPQDVLRLVRRAVVDDHDLEIRVALTQRAVDRIAEGVSAVVGRDDDADERGRRVAHDEFHLRSGV
jgi:hypothetical protein